MPFTCIFLLIPSIKRRKIIDPTGIWTHLHLDVQSAVLALELQPLLWGLKRLFLDFFFSPLDPVSSSFAPLFWWLEFSLKDFRFHLLLLLLLKPLPKKISFCFNLRWDGFGSNDSTPHFMGNEKCCGERKLGRKYWIRKIDRDRYGGRVKIEQRDDESEKEKRERERERER